MRPRENYTPFVAAGLGLSLAILATFQIHILGEPARIQAVEAADHSAAVSAGSGLYAENCVECHGENGEGKVGPALNSRELLEMTSDETFASLIRTGVPGTVMPAWGQAFGGPFTDQQVNQLVAYIRAWEPTAPEIAPAAAEADPARGADIFASTCFICHGQNGQGTERAPALNDPQRLKQFDDIWYRDTITHGRPAKGMPTWGTVLSPQQIDDVVALLAAWREGQTVTPGIPIEAHLYGALFALRQVDALDAVFHLNAALTQASGPQAREAGTQAVLDLVTGNDDLTGAEAQLSALLGVPSAGITLPPGSVEQGQVLFADNCATCHGADGTGGMGRNLRNNKFTQSQGDVELVTFILTGRPGTSMDGFQGMLTIEQLSHIVALLHTWQK